LTYLPAQVTGRWFHLCLILDLYSRKIVGAEVHDRDDSDHAVHLVRRTALAEGIATRDTRPVLHGDNGSTLKATTVLAMLTTGWASSHRTRGSASATTTPMPSPYSGPPSTGPSSRPRASPISPRPKHGRRSSCVGTTSIIVTAALAT